MPLKPPKHFLDIDAVDSKTLRAIIDLAAEIKRKGRVPKSLKLKPHPVLAMIFEKPSTRTRVSFEVAIHQLGGTSLALNPQDMQLGRGETLADTARVLSRYVDAIMIRTGPLETLTEIAAHASVPVINGLTCRSHPCQVMADVMTFEELKGPIKGRIIAWIGDANNVATSWVHAAARFGFALRIASPPAFSPSPALLGWARAEGATIDVSDDPLVAARGADCVVTDVWVSMGDNDANKREAELRPFQVDEKVMAAAAKDAIFMHCLPAHRGDEVTEAVIDGPQSAVWDEAENRLHVQKAILAWCLGAGRLGGEAKRGAIKGKARGRAMTEHQSEERVELNIPQDDLILPFQAEQADVVGRLVKLGPTVDTILSRHAYPEPVSKLLGEAVALTALLGAALKFEGKFILQASTDGPVDLLVADYQVPGGLRGYARFSAERLAELPADGRLLGEGHLAMTIDRGVDTERYQGVVPLEGESLTEAADTYFRQSEQLPTFIRLAVARHYRAGSAGGRSWTWRAGGLLVQKLTREGGRSVAREAAFSEEDWTRAKALAETVEDHELLDPLLPPDRLLYRLFHEEQVRAFRAIPLESYCSCSRERVEELLRRFSAEDLAEMVVDGEMWVTCEFCNSRYQFDPASFADA